MSQLSGSSDGTDTRQAMKREAVEAAYEQLAKYHVDRPRIVFSRNQDKRSGGYGTVRRAELYHSAYLPSWLASRLQGPPQIVAVKQIRMSAADDSFEMKRAFAKELLVWSSLRDHPGISKFIGYYADFERSEAWLLAPWEPHGNVAEFISRRHLEVPEKLSLVYDTIDALTFLHQRTPPICHGDVKSANVLVNAGCRAVFCDFGLARIFEDGGLGRLETSTGFKGSIRWCSPELLEGGPRTPNSDVYAWAWLVWEIMTGELPYQETAAEYAVILKIFQSPRPQVDGESRLSECLQLWELMTRCWTKGPDQRPTSRMCHTTVSFLPRCIPSLEGVDTTSPSAELMENLGELESWRGNYDEAVSYLQKAHELYNQRGDDKGIANVLHKQVIVFDRHSRYSEAIELASIAVEKFRKLNDDLGTADALHYLGRSLVATGKNEDALPHLSEALEIFRVHGHDVGAVDCLERIAEIHRLDRRDAESLSALEDALVLASQSGDRVGEVNVLSAQAYAFWDSGDTTKATATLRTACDTARQIGYVFGVCECLEALASIKVQEGSYEEAEEICQESVSLARSVNYGLLLARSFGALGGTLREQGKFSQAAAALENAYSAFQDISFPGTEGADVARDLATVKERLGDVQATLFWLEQAIAEYRRLRKWEHLSSVLLRMGIFLLKLGRYSDAALYFEASWILFHEAEYWGTRTVIYYLARIPKTVMQAVA